MDETRWLSAASPLYLLAHLRRLHVARTKAGRRKLRLFACACCRRLWPALRDEQRAIVEAAERAADGPTDQQAVMQALHAAYPINIPESIGSIFSFIMGLFGGRRMPPGVEKPPPDPPELRQLFWRLTHTRTWDVVGAWRLASSDALTPLRRTPPREEFHVQADLVRCLFGNPFRPMTLDPAWRTTAAVGLARGIYEANAFDRLPILADALEDAGCDDAAVLAHCRTDAVHARGCYVVDALLSSR